MAKKQIYKGEVSDSLLKFREKRKWQIAMRRYIMEGNLCTAYAPYFGIDKNNFRKWIELQFNEDIGWYNFSDAWQFDHIIPVTYFDFSDEKELMLCWNFTNIRVEQTSFNRNRGNRVDVLTARAYFQDIYTKTGYSIVQKILNKIERIELSQIKTSQKLEEFINNQKEYLETITNFSIYEFEQLNSELTVKQVLEQRELLKKYS